MPRINRSRTAIPLRQTRARSKLDNASPLMEGLDDRGQPRGPLPSDPENITYTEVLQRLNRRPRIILRTPSRSPPPRRESVAISASNAVQGPPVRTIYPEALVQWVGSSPHIPPDSPAASPSGPPPVFSSIPPAAFASASPSLQHTAQEALASLDATDSDRSGEPAARNSTPQRPSDVRFVYLSESPEDLPDYESESPELGDNMPESPTFDPYARASPDLPDLPDYESESEESEDSEPPQLEPERPADNHEYYRALESPMEYFARQRSEERVWEAARRAWAEEMRAVELQAAAAAALIEARNANDVDVPEVDEEPSIKVESEDEDPAVKPEPIDSPENRPNRQLRKRRRSDDDEEAPEPAKRARRSEQPSGFARYANMAPFGALHLQRSSHIPSLSVNTPRFQRGSNPGP